MAAINSATLVGRVVRDIELKTTESGKSVTSFTLAVDGYGKDAPANFIDIVAWNKAAEILSEYGTKGKQIGITGRISTRTWEDNDGNKRKQVEVVVDQFQLLGSKGDGHPESAPTPTDDVVIDDIDDKPIDLSEIPF